MEDRCKVLRWQRVGQVGAGAPASQQILVFGLTSAHESSASNIPPIRYWSGEIYFFYCGFCLDYFTLHAAKSQACCVELQRVCVCPMNFVPRQVQISHVEIKRWNFKGSFSIFKLYLCGDFDFDKLITYLIK